MFEFVEDKSLTAIKIKILTYSNLIGAAKGIPVLHGTAQQRGCTPRHDVASRVH